MTMISAMRVTWVNAPVPMVVMPSCQQARCDSGTLHRYQASANGKQHERRDQPLGAPAHQFGLQLAGTASPSMRLQVTSAQTPASETQTSDAQEQARPVGRVEEGLPEPAGFLAGARHRQPRLARRQHEGQDAVDDDQGEERGHGIDPADLEVQLVRRPGPTCSNRPPRWSVRP